MNSEVTIRSLQEYAARCRVELQEMRDNMREFQTELWRDEKLSLAVSLEYEQLLADYKRTTREIARRICKKMRSGLLS